MAVIGRSDQASAASRTLNQYKKNSGTIRMAMLTGSVVGVAIAAIPAIAVSWGTRTARYLFIASLMIIMLEFLIPALFAPLLQGLAIGTAVRVVIGASASILAFVGLNRLCL